MLGALSTGHRRVPAGAPCAGTELQLGGQLYLLGQTLANVGGEASLSVSVPGRACGASVQAVDLSTCVVSNLDTL